MTKDTDKELEALAVVARALDKLSRASIERILRFAADRHNVNFGPVTVERIPVPVPMPAPWPRPWIATWNSNSSTKHQAS